MHKLPDTPHTMDIRAVDREPELRTPRLRHALIGMLLATLALLCLLILRPFLSPILWAAILAYVTWPLYRRLRCPFGSRRNLAAALMTLLMAAVAVVPLLGVLLLLQRELSDAYRAFTEFLSRGPHTLPTAIRDVPGLGPWLQNAFDRYSRDPAALAREFTGDLQYWGGQLAAFLGSVGRNLGKVAITILTLFFYYRDGDSLLQQARRVILRFFGDRLDRSIATAGAMTRAVVRGFLATALGQGLIAGIGYWIFGIEAPVLLGVLTGVLSTAPVIGTAFVWAPLAVWLALAGYYWKSFLLVAWCSLLVHPVDNLLRPLLISNVTRVPFLLVMFGVIGGLAAFGFVGLFIGPIILGVATAIWNDWATEGATDTAAAALGDPEEQEPGRCHDNQESSGDGKTVNS